MGGALRLISVMLTIDNFRIGIMVIVNCELCYFKKYLAVNFLVFEVQALTWHKHKLKSLYSDSHRIIYSKKNIE